MCGQVVEISSFVQLSFWLWICADTFLKSTIISFILLGRAEIFKIPINYVKHQCIDWKWRKSETPQIPQPFPQPFPGRTLPPFEMQEAACHLLAGAQFPFRPAALWTWPCDQLSTWDHHSHLPWRPPAKRDWGPSEPHPKSGSYSIGNSIDKNLNCTASTVWPI